MRLPSGLNATLVTMLCVPLEGERLGALVARPTPSPCLS